MVRGSMVLGVRVGVRVRVRVRDRVRVRVRVRVRCRGPGEVLRPACRGIGRYKEIWGDIGRCREVRGDMIAPMPREEPNSTDTRGRGRRRLNCAMVSVEVMATVQCRQCRHAYPPVSSEEP